LNAEETSFDKIEFTKIEDSIQIIDLTNNPKLKKIPFLSNLLNNKESKLQKIIIDKFLFDITEEK